jgi:hypothetical protein
VLAGVGVDLFGVKLQRSGERQQLLAQGMGPSWANLVRSDSGLNGFDDPRDMVG